MRLKCCLATTHSETLLLSGFSHGCMRSAETIEYSITIRIFYGNILPINFRQFRALKTVWIRGFGDDVIWYLSWLVNWVDTATLKLRDEHCNIYKEGFLLLNISQYTVNHKHLLWRMSFYKYPRYPYEYEHKKTNSFTCITK